ncbi:NASP-related protein [Salix suchowensis]|nr:NASP-related protein [Salix suchowensis]
MDGIPGATPRLTIIISRGSTALKNGHFHEAARCFKKARHASNQLQGESTLERSLLHHFYGISLLCEIPFQGDGDPLEFVPKEADYYLFKDRSYSSYSKLYSGTVSPEDYANQMEAAQKELKIAWSLLENESNFLKEKANTLSALGEVALRRGEANPERYYIQASSFLESLQGEINKQRMADINVKICICLEGSDKIKAIEYGEKALSSYQTLLKKLISETQSPSKSVETQTSSDSESSSATQIDPSIQRKKSERSMLIKILSKLQFKLDDLKAGSSTSPNLEGTSEAPAGHRDGKGKMSRLIQVLKSEKQFDN